MEAVAMPSAAATAPAARWRRPLATTKRVSGPGDTTTAAATTTKAPRRAGSSTSETPERRSRRLPVPRSPVNASRSAAPQQDSGRAAGRLGGVADGIEPQRDAAGEEELALFRQRVELRSEEHKSELQSPMRISYAVFCLKN